jgi:hypothetical protein
MGDIVTILEQVLGCKIAVDLVAEGEGRRNPDQGLGSPGESGVSWHIDGRLARVDATLRTPAGPHSLSLP